TVNRSLATPFLVTGEFGVPPSLLNPTAVFGVLLPLSDLQVLAGDARSSGGTIVDAADTIQVSLSASASTDIGAIHRVANEIGAMVPFYGITLLTDEVSSLRSSAAVLTGFYLALSSVSLAVGLLFLAVVLVRLVEAERRSIGVERALGVPGSQIARRMAARALALSSAGALGGVAGGVLIVMALENFGSPLVREAAGLAVFDPTTLLALVVGVLSLSLVASLGATRSALKIRIAEALR
ncbi:MAG: hypothetical protein L3K09_07630, partial [Thermoplasmata archaeon]|nr:hypothetical protein [Thermoplasmata archaeon]